MGDKMRGREQDRARLQRVQFDVTRAVVVWALQCVRLRSLPQRKRTACGSVRRCFVP